MRFIDSNVLAYAFYENEHRHSSRKILSEGGITNTLNLVEAFAILEAETSRERAEEVIRSLLKSRLHIVPVDANLIFEALKLNMSNLRFFDKVHYATARAHACSEIASYDHDFDGLDIPRVA